MSVVGKQMTGSPILDKGAANKIHLSKFKGGKHILRIVARAFVR